MEWTLRQLSLFISVADAQSLSAAAERLGMAQPAVSITIRNLERATRTRLFDRRPTGVVLTNEGRVFLEHARTIIAQAQSAERHLQQLQGLERGELVIGAPMVVAAYILPDLLNRFISQHPGIRVRVVQDGAEAVAERVRRAEFELGFIADRGTSPELASMLIERHPMVACAQASSPLAARERLEWQELMAHPLIQFPRDFYQRKLVEDLAARLNLDLNVVVETESVPLMLSLVREGRGIATLLRASVPRSRGVVPISLPAGADVPIAVCYRKDLVLSLASQAFLRVIKRSSGG